MIEILFTVAEAPEGGLAARAVGHSIFTEADTLDELRENVREAVEFHFDQGQAPKLIGVVGAIHTSNDREDINDPS